jgi:glycerophosphoryl diester phosphodiesterase
VELKGKIIAHRGASAYAPENTIAAFNMAAKLGCQFIEFDVMLSHDNVPFVFHDDAVRRTTNGRGDFAQKSAAEIQTLDAGMWVSKSFKNERIPSFEAVIRWLAEHDMQANIEIKPDKDRIKETTIAVLTTINRCWPVTMPMPLVSSFEMEALILARSLAPELPLGMLMHNWDNNWNKEAQALNCTSIHLSSSITTQKRVASIKDKGYKVYVYTVNRRRQAMKLFKWGVDAVFSDYPDLLA